MRPVNVSLDATTWELAKRKSNFSEWVRNKLREERNKSELPWKYCKACDTSMKTKMDYCVNKACPEHFMAPLS